MNRALALTPVLSGCLGWTLSEASFPEREPDYTFEYGCYVVTQESWGLREDRLERVTEWTYASPDDEQHLTGEDFTIWDGEPRLWGRYVYVREGQTAWGINDNNADGTIDQLRIETFGTDDHVIAVQLDTDGDGIDEQRFAYAYSRLGQLIRHEDDRDADGVVDSILTYTHTRSGDIATMVSDPDDDGEPDYQYTYAYSDGLLQRVTYSTADEGVTALIDYTYNSDGLLVEAASDNGADGSVDRRNTYTYDERGNLLTEEEDNSGNGLIDDRLVYTYDEADRVSTLEVYSLINDPHYGSEALYRLTYDDAGRLIEQITDRGINGTDDELLAWTYTDGC